MWIERLLNNGDIDLSVFLPKNNIRQKFREKIFIVTKIYLLEEFAEHRDFLNKKMLSKSSVLILKVHVKTDSKLK